MADRGGLMAAHPRERLASMRDDRLVARVRRGDARAFECIYERHASKLLAFCIFMLGSEHDAEDALQATFASAYRAIVSTRRPITLKPWLFTIARNQSVTILRRRRSHAELNGEPALTGDPVRRAELREELGEMLEGIRELPEEQRAALVLAEVHGLSQPQIGSILGVRPQQVKAYVYQARSNLISEREAHETDCGEVREELATRTSPRLKGRIRRHLRSCDGCQLYAAGVKRQRRQFASMIPFLPALALKYHAIEEALRFAAGDGANYPSAAAAAEVAGGGAAAVVIKVAAGLAALGASAGVGVSVLGGTAPSRVQESPAAEIASAGQRPGTLSSTATTAIGSRSLEGNGRPSRSGAAPARSSSSRLLNPRGGGGRQERPPHQPGLPRERLIGTNSPGEREARHPTATPKEQAAAREPKGPNEAAQRRAEARATEEGRDREQEERQRDREERAKTHEEGAAKRREAEEDRREGTPPGSEAPEGETKSGHRHEEGPTGASGAPGSEEEAAKTHKHRKHHHKPKHGHEPTSTEGEKG